MYPMYSYGGVRIYRRILLYQEYHWMDIRALDRNCQRQVCCCICERGLRNRYIVRFSAAQHTFSVPPPSNVQDGLLTRVGMAVLPHLLRKRELCGHSPLFPTYICRIELAEDDQCKLYGKAPVALLPVFALYLSLLNIRQTDRFYAQEQL